MNEAENLLIVHSDSKISENISRKIGKMLDAEGYETRVCGGPAEGVRSLKENLYSIVLLDTAAISEDPQGFLQFINKYCPETLVIPLFWHAPPQAVGGASGVSPDGAGDGLVDLEAMKMTIRRLSGSLRVRNKEKENQREILRMAKDLQESNQRLMDMDRKKNNCLAVATHELRTPITIVNGYLKLLLSESFGDLNDKQRHLLRESSKYCGRLITLVNSMLDRCRLESDAVEFQYQKDPYLRRLRKVVSQMENFIEESGLVVSLEVPEDDLLISFDPNAIEQVLINLIGNAVKFTPPPGKITVRSEIKPDGVLTQVIDTGVGIEPHEKEKVFEEFNSVGKKHGDKKGAGLGLSICRRIIRAHDGEIWVESEPGKGCCFSFLLPRKTSDTTDSQN